MKKQNIQVVDSLLYETFLLQKRELKFFNENNNQQKVVPSTSKRNSGYDDDINESECGAKTEAMKNLSRSKVLKKLPQSSSASGKSSFLQCNTKSISSSHQNKIPGKENKLWECPICFEQSKGQEVVTTICGHVFCHICILEHLRQSKCSQCPSCRSPIGNNTLITLYNV